LHLVTTGGRLSLSGPFGLIIMATGGPSFTALSRYNGCPGAFSPITPENYQSETERIKSFVGWPLNRAVHPEQLARVGFVYTGEGALVQCFQCGAKYRHWYEGDIPLNVHQKCNPCCPFLQTFTCKRKPARSEMVICTGRVLTEQRETSLHTRRDDEEYATIPPLYRGTTSLYSSVEQSTIQSFPHYGLVDHNPQRDLVCDENVINSCDSNRVMPSLQPLPAQSLPVQSMQTTDHSAVLIGDTTKPLQACVTMQYCPATAYKVRL